jgi:predicted short-subunit dehydrogenase-like oxidoreductase (DUF2520 family)
MRQEVIKINIGFIGAGKVGFSLGKYFKEKGLILSGYYSKNLNSAVEAAEFTNSKAFDSIEELVKCSDIIFLTVPDDLISVISKELSKYDLIQKIICHTSGSLSSQVLNNSNNSSATFYSIHPIYPFSDKHTSYKNLNDIYFSLEGSKENFNVMKNLIQSLGNKVIELNTKDKALYHLSCVLVSNLTLSLIQIGCSYLEKFNLNEKETISALMPLITNNINNINRNGFTNSITGPIERGDISTVLKHMDVIPNEHRDLYMNLSKNLLNLCINVNANRDYSEMYRIFGGQNNETNSSNI